MLHYPATVHREGESFWIEFPDFPATYTYGDTGKDDPSELAAACLADAIWFRLKDGDGIPEPSVPLPGQLVVAPRRRIFPVEKSAEESAASRSVKVRLEAFRKKRSARMPGEPKLQP